MKIILFLLFLVFSSCTILTSKDTSQSQLSLKETQDDASFEDLNITKEEQDATDEDYEIIGDSENEDYEEINSEDDSDNMDSEDDSDNMDSEDDSDNMDSEDEDYENIEDSENEDYEKTKSKDQGLLSWLFDSSKKDTEKDTEKDSDKKSINQDYTEDQEEDFNISEEDTSQGEEEDEDETEILEDSKDTLTEEPKKLQKKPLAKAPVKKNIPLQKIKTKTYKKQGHLVNAVYIARAKDTLTSISNAIYASNKLDLFHAINPHLKYRSVKTGDKIYYNSPLRPTDTTKLVFYYEDIKEASKSFYMLKSGDNIRTISQKLLGHPNSWKEIWATNPDVVSKTHISKNINIFYWPKQVKQKPTQDMPASSLNLVTDITKTESSDQNMPDQNIEHPNTQNMPSDMPDQNMPDQNIEHPNTQNMPSDMPDQNMPDQNMEHPNTQNMPSDIPDQNIEHLNKQIKIDSKEQMFLKNDKMLDLKNKIIKWILINKNLLLLIGITLMFIIIIIMFSRRKKNEDSFDYTQIT